MGVFSPWTRFSSSFGENNFLGGFVLCYLFKGLNLSSGSLKIIYLVHNRFLKVDLKFQQVNRFQYNRNITQPKHFVILFQKYNLEVYLFKKGSPKISLGRPFSYCEPGCYLSVYISVCLSIYLSIYKSIVLSINLSNCLYYCLST